MQPSALPPSLESTEEINPSDIAVIGLAGRFPGARNIEEFWTNLRDGVESIRPLSTEELLSSGADPSQLSDPNYVKAGAVFQDLELFDAGFFGFSPKEAAIMDPQHRHFLECAWEALEHAGHAPENFNGSIGVFAGSGMNAYLMWHILPNRQLMDSVGLFLLRHTGNDKDFLTTRLSYCLNLKGPSINVQTACSTSLVAIHLACQHLLNGECDLALAGGVSLELPHRRGYLYQEGEILSPDGHCRAFDALSKGTVFGSGAGVVVLRRLQDAARDRDFIHAIIKGSAINNDGKSKVGYLAPSVDGQAEAISQALAISGVDPESITYIEAHGTGTPVGDPIELNALTQAFAARTKKKNFCKIGSVKTNIGHLDTAAGVASFIKTVLALRHQQLPPSLHFSTPNPLIDFQNSPFTVQSTLQTWNPSPHPRRAGVSSLGVGGTNAHVILEEGPPHSSAPESRPWKLLTFAGRSPAVLEQQKQRLLQFLETHPGANLSDAAFTLQTGRSHFKHRAILSCRDVLDALLALRDARSPRVFASAAADTAPSVVFLFPGGGAQYPLMGQELHQHEPVFRQQVDRCLDILQSQHRLDLKPWLFPPQHLLADAAAQLEKPSLSILSIFIVEYALAKLWISWGIKPAALTGHSLGEYTAACLSEVMSLEDALALVTLRGKLFESLPEGAMLSVPLSERDARQRLTGLNVSIAAVNAPSSCVLSGPVAAIAALETSLAAEDIESHRIRISVAAHSEMLDPCLKEFAREVASIRFHPPKIPYVSNLTGDWITPQEAVNPGYWVNHLRQTVRFADGLQQLLSTPSGILLEVGPGTTLSSLVKQHPLRGEGHAILASLRHPKEPVSDLQFILTTLGRIWAAGGAVDWRAYHAEDLRSRIPLPAYPFEHQRHWIPASPSRFSPAPSSETPSIPAPLQRQPFEDWFYRPIWKNTPLPTPAQPAPPAKWLLFLDPAGLGDAIRARLLASSFSVIGVRPGPSFEELPDNTFLIPPSRPDAYVRLLELLAARRQTPDRIAYFWTLPNTNNQTPSHPNTPPLIQFQKSLESAFNPLLCLSQAFGELDHSSPLRLFVISDRMFQVRPGETLNILQAPALGPMSVIPREFPSIACRGIDLDLSTPPPPQALQTDAPHFDPSIVQSLLQELSHDSPAPIIACRDGNRWTRDFERIHPVQHPGPAQRLRRGGVYLITGAFGGIGLELAEYLIKTVSAKLILVGRTVLPPPSTWNTHATAPPPNSNPALSQILARLQSFEELGAEFLPLTADVANASQMESVVRSALDRFGVLHGIFHAAGAIDDQPIQLKSLESAQNVLAPKILGALVLNALAKDLRLDLFVLFSSTSAFLGLPGQIDYAAANAFLNAYAASKTQNSGAFTTAINWGLWREVGMAARALAAPANAPARLTEPPPQPIASAPNTVPPATELHPLLGRLASSSSQEHVFSSAYTSGLWVLDQHRIRGGHAVMPGTGYLEIIRASLQQVQPSASWTIRNLFFLAPLELRPGESKNIRVTLRPKDQGYEFSLVSRPQSPLNNGEEWREHAHCEITPQPCPHPKPLPSLAELQARCARDSRHFTAADKQSSQETYLEFGPRWKNLRSIHCGDREILSLLELPEPFQADLRTYELHPALLDIATGAGLHLLPQEDPSAQCWYAPLSYKEVAIHAPLPLPARLWSHVRCADLPLSSNGIVKLDATLFNDLGQPLLEVEELVMRRIQPGESLGSHSSQPAALQNSRAAATNNTLPKAAFQPRSTSPLQDWLPLGISPAEGLEALNRILSSDPLPQVIVSSIDLPALAQQLQPQPRQPLASDATAPDPSPAPAAASGPPRDDIERTLCKLWEESLGAQSLGIRDNFFELGGHSLIAVRLFSKIKKTYQVDLGLSVLFEAPTVERCAEIIRAKLNLPFVPEPAPAKTQSITPAIPAAAPPAPTKTTHSPCLVPIKPTGSRPPLFVIHGMGGTILEYSDLARYLNPGQPLYGIQAQGLDGKAPIFQRVEEIAAQYREEIKTIQPHGPYYLGGSSFGGLVAYEMAQQWHAQGEKVALLALFDSYGKDYPKLLPKTTRFRNQLNRFAMRVRMHAENLSLLELRNWPSYLFERIAKTPRRAKKQTQRAALWMRRQLQLLFLPKLLRDQFRLTAEQDPKIWRFNLPKIYAEIGKSNVEAGRKYQLRPYPGSATLFRATHQPLGIYPNRGNGWEELVLGGLEIIDVTGFHGLMREPRVRELAPKLNACLERAQQQHPRHDPPAALNAP